MLVRCLIKYRPQRVATFDVKFAILVIHKHAELDQLRNFQKHEAKTLHLQNLHADLNFDQYSQPHVPP